MTDERTCAKAAAAHAGARRVYVVKLGRDYFAVMDPDRSGTSEFVAVAVYDKRWVRVGGWAGGG